MTIRLIHPSRSRPQKAYVTANKWLDSAGHSDLYVRHTLSLDESDPKLNEYGTWFSPSKTRNIIINNNSSVVEATNKAAEITDDDILVYLSDDFDCPIMWSHAIMDEFKGVTGPMLLKVDDCLQSFDVRVLTIPIMNRALYERLGYFWHPEYKSMFVDEDLWWTCRNNGWLKKAPHLKFPHLHHSIGKSQNDETYRRSEANWDQGKALFARRKAAGFPL